MMWVKKAMEGMRGMSTDQSAEWRADQSCSSAPREVAKNRKKDTIISGNRESLEILLYG